MSEDLRAHLLSLSDEDRRDILVWLRQVAADLGVNVQGELPAEDRQVHCDRVAANLLEDVEVDL